MDNIKEKNSTVEDRRLWIGNLDPRVTEYQLLKLTQKYGSIEKFDLIFHRNGPLIGQPRGYAFITYSNKEEAIAAKDTLNNKLIGQKIITVTWAHSINNDESDRPKEEVFIPALAMSKSGSKTDKLTQIQEIEAKLKMMEKKKEDELRINETVATKPPIILQYQEKLQNNINKSSNINSSRRNIINKRDRYSKPYTKYKIGR